MGNVLFLGIKNDNRIFRRFPRRDAFGTRRNPDEKSGMLPSAKGIPLEEMTAGLL